MGAYRFDVVIIGAGPAGVAAAGSLAGTGISVALIEAGAYAGAENWSGCVYFTESLAEPDCFGPAAVQEAPFERQLVRRGTLVHNGVDEVGLALTDAAAFRHCYTVLRPVYDPYFAHLAEQKGVMLLTGITATSLLRRDGRVIGVSTSQGMLHAGVVFLAEGDASHLVRSERLERVPEPHFLQGVKAVLSLPAGEIEKRFGLSSGEGAAYEIVLRNGSLGGRTARLNLGGFLYTNRDSLSAGYVVPLENLKRHYRGDHSLLFEWMRSLPWIADLLGGASLSAYGAKIIRSGGWRERPVLVEDGLAVGGAATGLGTDLPFPNFTGPAAASGLYFGRAVRSLLRNGRSLDRRNLAEAYLEPLQASVYGRNSRFLSSWPSYFGRTPVLFGRTPDLVCGTARFLAAGNLADASRFLRSHLLSLRAIRELLSDNVTAAGSLRLWKPLAKTLMHPATIGCWIANLFRRPAHDNRLRIIVNVSGARPDLTAFGWPINSLVRRLSPALAKTLALIYSNNDSSLDRKLSEAATALVRALRLTDIVVLPAYGLSLAALSLATALHDAFRYYVLRVPAEKLLAEPVMAYREEQRKARDLAAVKPLATFEAKLATNTYQVGEASHIRTAWPEMIASHGDMARTALWWVCPARVYASDAPLFGRGKVTVNWENCIKCESCWRAEPRSALWGRFTDHRLIYRPESAAVQDLLRSLEQGGNAGPAAAPDTVHEALQQQGPGLARAVGPARAAAAGYREAMAHLPASADGTRMRWPRLIGERLCDRIRRLEKHLSGESRQDAARELAAEREALSQRLGAGELVAALYSVRRIEQTFRERFGAGPLAAPAPAPAPAGNTAPDIERTFPQRTVKEWEERPLTAEETAALHRYVRDLGSPLPAVVRLLSAVSPALAWIVACQVRGRDILRSAGIEPLPGVCAAPAVGITIAEQGGAVALSGRLDLVPAAGASRLLLVQGTRAYPLPLPGRGVRTIPTPAIGFRAAGLVEVSIETTMDPSEVLELREEHTGEAALYLAAALGAADYLSTRVREHAAGRIQFSGQMLDTEGRDGIAKLGAVKAMISRVEAWKLLLEALYEVQSANRDPQTDMGILCSALAALAFSPEPGALGYDAGQVFGGFAYSEDDLLARYYRDSALFRFLAPGLGAAERFLNMMSGQDLSRILPDELETLDAIAGPPLAPLVERWHTIAAAYRDIGADRSRDRLFAGQAAALLTGLRLLFARTERGLDAGRNEEAAVAAIEVLLGLAQRAVDRAAQAAERLPVPPTAVFPMAPAGAAKDLGTDYETFCERPGAPYRSGAFLHSVFDRSPRYVPEMQLHDPRLRDRWQELTRWFREHCGDRSFDGRPFEREVERLHNLPVDILEAVKEQRWLATSVPPDDDGLGWRKADYYSLNAAAGSFGDAGICLLIMASTSIGTTPVLLGLEEELPRVREELEPLAADPRRLGEISRRIDGIVASFRHPDPGRIRKEYEAAMALVDRRVRRTRVVKYLGANFLKAFYAAGIAGQRGDFTGFTADLARAAALCKGLQPDVVAALDELPRRERSHRSFLRNLGHGGVAAFALTEPAAGSDTGGVRTTARLLTAELAPLDDGRYSFTPAEDGGAGVRYLIDADRLRYTDQGLVFRTPDGSESAVALDRATGRRSFTFRGQDRPFHDIGQVRDRGKGPCYEYYSLTGSKMWITNGGIATQFSLYAQTNEGVTGFMVDRFAEGLVVGADERKMGQRGSPTNEIALDSVRAPREAVIGYEGHGQVNALETLNVGRCGLAVVAGALMRKVIAEAERALLPAPERDALLGEAAAIVFGSESVAYHLIGLFDRPHESVRIESAVAKYLCSEDLHEVLSLVERAWGPAGQTERFLLEKARRDSRILNIYEGTNEVQRFLILKDLIAMDGDWPELPESLPERPGDLSGRLLARWKNRLRTQVGRVRLRFGDAAWADAMLQPALFLLPEMAGEILRLECILFRKEWLRDREALLGADYTGPLLLAAERSRSRTEMRLDRLEAAFGEAWQRLSADLFTADTVLCDAVLAAKPAAVAAWPLPPPQLPLRMLVLLRPVAELSPRPRLENGSLAEVLWTIDPADRAALETARTLQSGAGPGASIDVLLPGPPRHERLLRDHAAAADRLIRIEADAFDQQAIAGAVLRLEERGRYDLILAGATCSNGDSTLAAFLAGMLGRGHLRSTEVGAAGWPSVISVDRALLPQQGNIHERISGRLKTIEVVQATAPAAAPPRFSLPVVRTENRPVVTTVAAAADLLRAYAAAKRSDQAPDFHEDFVQGLFPQGPAAWTLVGPDSAAAGPAAVRAGRMAADLFGIPCRVLLACPGELRANLAGMARGSGAPAVWHLDTGHGGLSETGRTGVLELLREYAKGSLVFAGTAWNDAMARAAGRSMLVVKGVSAVDLLGDGFLSLAAPCYHGRLLRRDRLSDDPAFVTLLDNAVTPVPPAAGRFAATELAPAQASWTAPPAPPRPLTLDRAEVIIDLGYGIRDQQGLELARELKRSLERLGLEPFFGATRKVTQDLKLLPLDAQIGQTGVRVNPKLLIALGISGAPQHVDWIAPEAEVLCFNKDPEAPLMRLNRSRSAPRVHPVEGDLFAALRELLALLEKDGERGDQGS